ncbi:hypothetical protein CIB84_016554, partial [Bambusicola thoracicus]
MLPKHRSTGTRCCQPCPCCARRAPPRAARSCHSTGTAGTRARPPLASRPPSPSPEAHGGRPRGPGSAREPPRGQPPAPQLTPLERRIVELHREAAA